MYLRRRKTPHPKPLQRKPCVLVLQPAHPQLRSTGDEGAMHPLPFAWEVDEFLSLAQGG